MESMLPIEMRFRPEGGIWLAQCPALDLMTQGKTFEESQHNLQEALMLFMESCLRRGTLESVLREAGFTPIMVKEVQDFIGNYNPAIRESATRCHA